METLGPFKGIYRVILGLYWGYLGAILGSYWGYIGVILGIYWGYIGDMLVLYWCYIGVILGLYWDNTMGFVCSGRVALGSRCVYTTLTLCAPDLETPGFRV